MSNIDTGGIDRVRQYLADPGEGIAFVLAGEQGETAPSCVLILAGGELLGKMTFDEAWTLADFLYEMLPPRDKSGMS